MTGPLLNRLGPERPTPLGVGVIAPYDFALDDELWRWLPPRTRLYVTRTPHEDIPVGLSQAQLIGNPEVIGRVARDIATPEPIAVAYMCTSGSFVCGVDGEQRIVGAMLESGIPVAVTTSGALIHAATTLGIQRIGIATPYEDQLGSLLATFIEGYGLEPAATVNLGLPGKIWTLPRETTMDLVRRTAHAQECDAVFLSCTNVPTYDLIAVMEDELGIPVLTANQVTMWAALGYAGIQAVGPGQRLVEHLPTRPDGVEAV